MFAVIFGRPGCPYCVRAKQIAEQLVEQRDDFKFRYVDIHAEGITKKIWPKAPASRSIPCRKSSWTSSTSVAAPISKPMPKRTWVSTSKFTL